MVVQGGGVAGAEDGALPGDDHGHSLAVDGDVAGAGPAIWIQGEESLGRIRTARSFGSRGYRRFDGCPAVSMAPAPPSKRRSLHQTQAGSVARMDGHLRGC
jgi:hypothetical protein